MLIILIDICCDNCANIKKEYKTIDENNVFGLVVCKSAPGYIRFVFPPQPISNNIYNITHTKKKGLCINYIKRSTNAN